MNCSTVKYNPRATVKIIEMKAPSQWSSTRDMCAQVMVAPDDSSTVVLSKGRSKG